MVQSKTQSSKLILNNGKLSINPPSTYNLSSHLIGLNINGIEHDIRIAFQTGILGNVSWDIYTASWVVKQVEVILKYLLVLLYNSFIVIFSKLLLISKLSVSDDNDIFFSSRLVDALHLRPNLKFKNNLITFSNLVFSQTLNVVNKFSVFTIINFSKLIYQSETDVILEEEFYNDILFLHNFNNINNLGIIYDESKNTNFLERVPKEYIK